MPTIFCRWQAAEEVMSVNVLACLIAWLQIMCVESSPANCSSDVIYLAHEPLVFVAIACASHGSEAFLELRYLNCYSFCFVVKCRCDDLLEMASGEVLQVWEI